jgi:uncharacterized protein YwqG
MSFWSRLFGRNGGDRHDPPGRDIAALTASLAVPAVHAVRTEQPTSSHMGGRPVAPAGFQWPARDGVPLGFLAQIDLGRLQASTAISWLPATGMLLFFYDLVSQPWGIEPRDRSGWQVIYLANAVERHDVPFPSALGASERLRHQFLDFHAIRSFPSSQRATVDRLHLTDAEADAYFDLREQQFSRTPHHQLAGYPIEIQSDEMELEAALLSGGQMMAEAPHAHAARATALAAAAADWRLLFQIDSDEHLGAMWGDAGMLYFWVRASEAREGRFDSTWLVLQCH